MVRYCLADYCSSFAVNSKRLQSWVRIRGCIEQWRGAQAWARPLLTVTIYLFNGPVPTDRQRICSKRPIETSSGHFRTLNVDKMHEDRVTVSTGSWEFVIISLHTCHILVRLHFFTKYKMCRHVNTISSLYLCLSIRRSVQNIPVTNKQRLT